MKVLRLLMIIAVAVIAGCGQPKEEVLIVLKTLDNPFFIDIERGFKKEWQSNGMGYDVNVKAGVKEGDVASQRKILEEQFASKVFNRKKSLIKGLILTPSSSGGDLVDIVRKYRAAGVPVILLDTGINQSELRRVSSDYNLLIRSDNKLGGKVAADFISSKFKNKKCRVLLLNGVPDHDTAKERRDGFFEAAEINGLNIQLEKTANWRRDEAQRIVSQLISYWKYDAIFAANDEMALGAYSAIKQNKAETSVLIVGFDATDEARRSIRNNGISASIAQEPFKMGAVAASSMVELLAGKQMKPFSEILLAPLLIDN